MKSLFGVTFDELKIDFVELGLPAYRAEQVMNAIYRGQALADVTTLSKDLRAKLAERYTDFTITALEEHVSQIDGTVKYLFALADGNVVEGVLMKYHHGNTVCISTQVGCRMNCAFCASGIGGLVRNMTADEMVQEVLYASLHTTDEVHGRGVTNIVLMGTGEPLDNYDEVLRFLHIVNDAKGLGISRRNISLSTSGIVDGIDRLADEQIDVNLTISLHNPFTEERAKIMPVTKAYPVDSLIRSARRYFDITGRRVYFEYCMIRGVNDSPRHAAELIRLLRGFPCHVNVIRLNRVEEKHLSATDNAAISAFITLLTEGGLSATLRRTMGSDINGACGQLRRKHTGGTI